MDELLKMLSGGDLRSDGRADEVIKKPQLFYRLIKGLSESDDVVRARTAHALERISRSNPKLLYTHLPYLLEIVVNDSGPMVKWHLAMMFGNLADFADKIDFLISALFRLLGDRSVFVKSWAIASLCVIGKKYTERRREIIRRVGVFKADKSIAIRTKVDKAIYILENDEVSIPSGWLKK